MPAKVRKRKSTLLRAAKHITRAPREWAAFEPAEVDSGAATDPETLQATQDPGLEVDDGHSGNSDRDSVASGLSDYDRLERADAPALALPSSPQKGNATSMEAVRKAAQVRFLTLVRTNSAAAAFVNAARKANEADRAALVAAVDSTDTSETSSHPSSGQQSGRTTPRNRNLTLTGVPALPVVRPMLRSSHSELVLPMPRGNLAPEELDSDAETPPATPSASGSTDVFAASFDSSAKQRVQSYTGQ